MVYPTWTFNIVSESISTKDMEYPKIWFGKFVLVFLCCYFSFVILKASDKLQSEQMGTIFRTVSKKTVQYPAITVCIFRSTCLAEDCKLQDIIDMHTLYYPNEPRYDFVTNYIYHYKLSNRFCYIGLQISQIVS